ncbi:MAG: sulfatase-like hydrolase/transferase [Chitinophagaceae bacterium]
MEHLKLLGVADNTIIIFSSDNGPVLDDGYQDGAVTQLHGHTPLGPFRGGKYSSYEAGTRVPFIISWPKKIKPAVSAAMISQMDLMASFAQLLNKKLTSGDGPDSENMLNALLGKSKKGRNILVEQGLPSLAIVKDDWKYIAPDNGNAMDTLTNIELGNNPLSQLYNLKNDIGEKNNLAEKYPEKVKELVSFLLSVKNKK